MEIEKKCVGLPLEELTSRLEGLQSILLPKKGGKIDTSFLKSYGLSSSDCAKVWGTITSLKNSLAAINIDMRGFSSDEMEEIHHRLYKKAYQRLIQLKELIPDKIIKEQNIAFLAIEGKE